MATTNFPLTVSVDVTDAAAIIKFGNFPVWAMWNDRATNPADTDCADALVAAFAGKFGRTLDNVDRPVADADVDGDGMIGA